MWVTEPGTKTRSTGTSPLTWYAMLTSPLLAYWTSGTSTPDSLRRAGRSRNVGDAGAFELGPGAEDHPCELCERIGVTRLLCGVMVMLAAATLAAGPSARTPRPSLSFRVFANTGHNMNTILWTGAQFLYVENTT